jgi:hypothetical protein
MMIRAGNATHGRLNQVISNLDGSHAKSFRLPDGLAFGSGPLSPDGTRVVLEGFTAPDFNPTSTYIANVDGSHVEVLTKDHFIPGDFSPDGKTVLLFRGPGGARGGIAPARFTVAGGGRWREPASAHAGRRRGPVLYELPLVA